MSDPIPDHQMDGRGAPVVAHTPGPWSIERYGSGDSLVIHSDADTRVCFMATPGQMGSFANCKANARLIAAAPTMLTALREVSEWLGDEPASEYPSVHDARVRALIRTVRAAIALAEGC